MSTATTTQQPPHFMHTNQKEIDWRYNSCEKLSHATPRSTIHWIGIVPLEIARECPKESIISFINTQQRLTTDKALTREFDGKPRTMLPISYNLECIKDQLRFSAKYLNLLLEETVDQNGVHSVSILFNKETGKAYGFYSDELWIDQDSGMIAHYTTVDPDNIELKTIKSNDRYNWQK